LNLIEKKSNTGIPNKFPKRGKLRRGGGKKKTDIFFPDVPAKEEGEKGKKNFGWCPAPKRKEDPPG